MPIKDPAERAAYGRKYRKANKQRLAEAAKEYYRTPERRYAAYKATAKERCLPFNISLQEFKTFWQKPCHYCGSDIETIGIDRIDNNIGYEISNLRSCCSWCNTMKLDHPEEAFLKHICKILHKLF
jgi:hypothetical protein